MGRVAGKGCCGRGDGLVEALQWELSEDGTKSEGWEMARETSLRREAGAS